MLLRFVRLLCAACHAIEHWAVLIPGTEILSCVNVAAGRADSSEGLDMVLQHVSSCIRSGRDVAAPATEAVTAGMLHPGSD